MNKFFTADDGAKISFTDHGSGQPLLCLAGLSRNSNDFQYLHANFNAARLICMDYRGRGASDWTGAATYTLERESADVLQLLAHLNLNRVAILGTSRGGLIGMGLASVAPQFVAGLCLNDIGPVIETEGLQRIRDYVGLPPAAHDYEQAARDLKTASSGFANVPHARWMQEAKTHFPRDSNGLSLSYDPALRQAFLDSFVVPMPEGWPFFDALSSIPVALIRGANSDLLSARTADEMLRRRPDLIRADVPDRGHVPFLDEPESLDVIQRFSRAVA